LDLVGTETSRAVPDHAAAHLRQAWAIFRRRRWLVFGITALGTLAAVAVIAQLEPRYRAEVLVLLEPRRSQIVTTKEVLSTPDVTDNLGLAASEVQVLQSDELSRRVIERLDLLELAEFQPDQRSGPLTEARRGLGRLVAAGTAWWQQVLVEAGLAQAAPAQREQPGSGSRAMMYAIRAYDKRGSPSSTPSRPTRSRSRSSPVIRSWRRGSRTSTRAST
jgi:Chain length determinant protein